MRVKAAPSLVPTEPLECKFPLRRPIPSPQLPQQTSLPAGSSKHTSLTPCSPATHCAGSIFMAICQRKSNHSTWDAMNAGLLYQVLLLSGLTEALMAKQGLRDGGCSQRVCPCSSKLGSSKVVPSSSLLRAQIAPTCV